MAAAGSTIAAAGETEWNIELYLLKQLGEAEVEKQGTCSLVAAVLALPSKEQLSRSDVAVALYGSVSRSGGRDTDEEELSSG